MLARDHRDIVGGVLLVGLGAFVAYYASTHYSLGEFSRMGPGMFPALVGGALSLVGLLIAGPACFRAGFAKPDIEWRPLITVMASMAGFAFTVTTFGMVPAIVLLVFVSAYADGRLPVWRVALLAGALSFIAILIFRILLGSPFAMFKWPF